MARGYPDFFGYSTFPWYGEIKEDAASVVAAIGATTTILELLGKRVIYTLAVIATGTDRIDNDLFTVHIDGNLVGQFDWAWLENHYCWPTSPTDFYGIFWDPEIYVGEARMQGLFGIGQSIKIDYINNGAAAVTVQCYVDSGIIK